MFSRKPVYMEEAGDDADGSSDGGGNASADNGQLELLTKSMNILTAGFQSLQENQAALANTLSELNTKVGTPVEHANTSPKDIFADVDLEQLDRKQFAQLMISTTANALKAEMNNLLGGVDDRISGLAERFESKNAEEQIGKVSGNNPDFWEWSGEIKTLLKENPTLSVSRAYNLAKTENPEKATKLSKQYNKSETKDQSFFGLTPTSTRTRGTGKMTQKEAAEKAFENVMGNLSAALHGEPN